MPEIIGGFGFIDEGLQGRDSDMSQIPTYVTAVPNGTEKVSHLSSTLMNMTDEIQGALFSGRPWRDELSSLFYQIAW